MLRHFIAINEVPMGADAGVMRKKLEEVAIASRRRGLRPLETMISPTQGRAYTFFEADAVESVRRLLDAVGLAVVDVVPGELVYTELLDEPNPTRPG